MSSIHAPDLDTAHTPTVVLARIVAAARSDGLLTAAEYARACACVGVVEQHARQRDEAMAQRDLAAREVERLTQELQGVKGQRTLFLNRLNELRQAVKPLLAALYRHSSTGPVRALADPIEELL